MQIPFLVGKTIEVSHMFATTLPIIVFIIILLHSLSLFINPFSFAQLTVLIFKLSLFYFFLFIQIFYFLILLITKTKQKIVVVLFGFLKVTRVWKDGTSLNSSQFARLTCSILTKSFTHLHSDLSMETTRNDLEKIFMIFIGKDLGGFSVL